MMANGRKAAGRADAVMEMTARYRPAGAVAMTVAAEAAEAAEAAAVVVVPQAVSLQQPVAFLSQPSLRTYIGIYFSSTTHALTGASTRRR